MKSSRITVVGKIINRMGIGTKVKVYDAGELGETINSEADEEGLWQPNLLKSSTRETGTKKVLLHHANTVKFSFMMWSQSKKMLR